MWRKNSGIINFKQHGSIPALNQAFGDQWVYIGRANNYAELPQSPLANPFKVKDFGGRGKTLPDYRRWLWERIQAGDEAVLAALKAIDESTMLVCWCKPGPCHGDVVRAAAEWLQTTSGKTTDKTAFISGHRNLSQDEFTKYYQPQLDKVMAADHQFVVGDAPGADAMAQRYLSQHIDGNRVTVYHVRQRPRFNAGFSTSGGYPMQSAKDAAMTAVSDYDIAWVRPGKETSGTARNLARR